MSEERDSADAAGDGSDAEDTGARGQTAVVTRPQRPTGKRSRQRAGAEEDTTASGAIDLAEEEVADRPGGKAKKDKKAKKNKKAATAKKAAKTTKDKKATKITRANTLSAVISPIIAVYTYLKQVVAEMRKVIWPNRKQMLTYTSVVVAFLAFMVALVALADFGLTKLVLLVFG